MAKIKKRILAKAMCVFRDGERIFVSKGYDPTKDQVFYRPLGGRIEFQEWAIDAVAREIMEEIEKEVHDLRYIGILESTYVYDGMPGHEIVLMYDGRFADEDVYSQEEVLGIEAGSDEPEFYCYWKTLDFFREGNAPLYPDGLLELLERDRQHE